MALCVNQSGTWRLITTLCVKQSSTWRDVVTGCINQSGTWRRFGGGTAPTTLGSSYGGGYAICLQGGFAGGVVWIVAPAATEVSRNWYCRDDAVTTAQASAACGDWFVPTCGQLKNPGSTCRTYWDLYSTAGYWSTTQRYGPAAFPIVVANGGSPNTNKTCILCVRSFRCVTY